MDELEAMKLLEEGLSEEGYVIRADRAEYVLDATSKARLIPRASVDNSGVHLPEEREGTWIDKFPVLGLDRRYHDAGWDEIALSTLAIASHVIRRRDVFPLVSVLLIAFGLRFSVKTSTGDADLESDAGNDNHVRGVLAEPGSRERLEPIFGNSERVIEEIRGKGRERLRHGSYNESEIRRRVLGLQGPGLRKGLVVMIAVNAINRDRLVLLLDELLSLHIVVGFKDEKAGGGIDVVALFEDLDRGVKADVADFGCIRLEKGE